MTLKPDKAMWERINRAFLDGQPEQNAGVVFVTLLSGAYALLVSAGVCKDEDHARAHLAATALSPDTGPVGSLLPMLEAELLRLGWQKPS